MWVPDRSAYMQQGLDFEDAAKRFWILDKNGLITRKRPDEELSEVVRPFAAIAEDDIEGEDLLSVVKRVRGQSSFLDTIAAISAAAATATAGTVVTVGCDYPCCWCCCCCCCCCCP